MENNKKSISQLKIFDLAGKDKEGKLLFNANTMLVGETGSGKTFLIKEYLFNRNSEEQVIVFDHTGNFEKFYCELDNQEKSKVGVLKLDDSFPNIIGKITEEYSLQKENMLIKIMHSSKEKLSASSSKILKANIKSFISNNIGEIFNLTMFKEYLEKKNTDKDYTLEEKKICLRVIEGLDKSIIKILENKSDFNKTLSSYQKVVVSYGSMLQKNIKESKYYILEVLLQGLMGYLDSKNQVTNNLFPYTMIVFEDAYSLIGKTEKLDSEMLSLLRTSRNYKTSIIIAIQNYNDIPNKLKENINFFVVLDKQLEKDNKRFFVFVNKKSGSEVIIMEIK